MFDMLLDYHALAEMRRHISFFFLFEPRHETPVLAYAKTKAQASCG